MLSVKAGSFLAQRPVLDPFQSFRGGGADLRSGGTAQASARN